MQRSSTFLIYKRGMNRNSFPSYLKQEERCSPVELLHKSVQVTSFTSQIYVKWKDCIQQFNQTPLLCYSALSFFSYFFPCFLVLIPYFLLHFLDEKSQISCFFRFSVWTVNILEGKLMLSISEDARTWDIYPCYLSSKCSFRSTTFLSVKLYFL